MLVTIAIPGAFGVLMLAGLGWLVLRGTTQEVQGTFTVTDGVGILEAQMAIEGLGPSSEMDRLLAMLDGDTFDCSTLHRGYRDIGAGTQVRINDASGELLAVSRLAGGTLDVRGCHFTFTVDVPRTDLYQFEVANRGAVA